MIQPNWTKYATPNFCHGMMYVLHIAILSTDLLPLNVGSPLCNLLTHYYDTWMASFERVHCLHKPLIQLLLSYMTIITRSSQHTDSLLKQTNNLHKTVAIHSIEWILHAWICEIMPLPICTVFNSFHTISSYLPWILNYRGATDMMTLTQLQFDTICIPCNCLISFSNCG